ncbi:MAG: hypothetical protein H0S85_03940 [Desulfovibrionaceae bacterium]|jgi:hypothetical protein|nr:hypothetical protein [Desulfovibrionaceae bacterium]
MSIGEFLGARGALNLRTVAMIWIAAWLALFVLLSWLSGGAERQLRSVKSEYARSSALVEKILDNQAERGDLAGQEPVAAARKVGADLGLAGAMASVREEEVGGRKGVALVFDSLDGRQFVELIKALRDRTGMTVTALSLSHRLDDLERADLKLTLAR